MLRSQEDDISLKAMWLPISGSGEIKIKLIDRDSYEGKKRGSKGIRTYLQGHVF